ncbi:hypothetical protein PsorP6_017695 [Peronosclerospora sorghi]|uniref:Uncharacterized protein n=1 Tax=Peronosclerospora sorghi TaxID=230839 RepID=A0ACC0WPI4_9STRA|nr:hypothetical protein PsorP6_017695 [Peronosclerospora sorghi]
MSNNTNISNSGPQQEQQLLLLTPRRRLRSGSGAGRGASFNNADIDSLLALSRQKLPRRKEEWDLVAELYNAGRSAYGGSRRSCDQLRSKYNRLRKEADDKKRSVRDAKQPTLPAGWEDFAAEYNSKLADGMLERTSRAFNAHFFSRLAGHKNPTGNPDCPQAVQRAKHLRRALLAKAVAQNVSNDAGLEIGIKTEEGDAEDNEKDGEEESEVVEMLDVDSGINDGEAEVSYSDSSNGGGGGCVEGVYGHSLYHNNNTGVRRTADPPASADAVRVADDERLIEDPGLPIFPSLPVQAGRNVSRNSGRPSRKGTPQPKSVTTTTPAAPRQGGLASMPTIKNDETFTSNAARTRNRIGCAAEKTAASAKQLGSVAVGMVTSQEERGRAHTQIVEMVDIRQPPPPYYRVKGQQAKKPPEHAIYRAHVPICRLSDRGNCRVHSLYLGLVCSLNHGAQQVAVLERRYDAAKHASSDGEDRVGENAEMLEDDAPVPAKGNNASDKDGVQPSIVQGVLSVGEARLLNAEVFAVDEAELPLYNRLTLGDPRRPAQLLPRCGPADLGVRKGREGDLECLPSTASHAQERRGREAKGRAQVLGVAVARVELKGNRQRRAMTGKSRCRPGRPSPLPIA